MFSPLKKISTKKNQFLLTPSKCSTKNWTWFLPLKFFIFLAIFWTKKPIFLMFPFQILFFDQK
jgi:hypothetical protein